jgi:hypothetical protein
VSHHTITIDLCADDDSVAVLANAVFYAAKCIDPELEIEVTLDAGMVEAAGQTACWEDA